MKTYQLLARGPAAAAFRARYPSHPGTLDWDAIETESDADDAQGEPAHARRLEALHRNP